MNNKKEKEAMANMQPMTHDPRGSLRDGAKPDSFTGDSRSRWNDTRESSKEFIDPRGSLRDGAKPDSFAGDPKGHDRFSGAQGDPRGPLRDDTRRRSKSVDGRRYSKTYDCYDSDDAPISTRSARKSYLDDSVGRYSSKNSEFSMFMVERENEKSKAEVEKLRDHKIKLIEELKNKIRESKKYKKKILECSNYYGEKLKKTEDENKYMKHMFEKKITKYENKNKEYYDLVEGLKKKIEDISLVNSTQKDLLYRKEKNEKFILKNLKKAEDDKKYNFQKKEKMEILVKDLSEKIATLQKIKDNNLVDDNADMRKEYEIIIEKLSKEKNELFEKYKNLVTNSNKNVDYLNSMAMKTKDLNEEISRFKIKTKEMQTKLAANQDIVDKTMADKDKIEKSLSMKFINIETQNEELEKLKVSNMIEIEKLKDMNDDLRKRMSLEIRTKEYEFKNILENSMIEIKERYILEKENYTNEIKNKTDEILFKKTKDIEFLKEKHAIDMDRITKMHEVEIIKLKSEILQ